MIDGQTFSFSMSSNLYNSFVFDHLFSLLKNTTNGYRNKTKKERKLPFINIFFSTYSEKNLPHKSMCINKIEN